MKSMTIQNELQRILELISVILQVDILMVDHECKKIAGSGIYEYTFGDQSYNDAFFERAAYNRSSFLISEDRTLTTKKSILEYQELMSTVHLYHSIIVDDHVFGIVKCDAVSSFAKQKFIENTEEVKHLIDQVVNRVIVQPDYKAILKEATKVDVLMNLSSEPMIYTLPNGRIERINQHAKEIFGLEDKHIGIQIQRHILSINCKRALDRCSTERKEVLNYKKGETYVRGFYRATVISIKDEPIGIVFTFDIIESTGTLTGEEGNRITFDNIIGNSDGIARSKEIASKVLKGTSTVLITGESGTGKELFARAIHNMSDRSQGPFIPINCAAIPENLLESELFGYEEGAFTGAIKGGKPGKFELANHGTVFLDEIGDMKVTLQSKLLRVLQENVVERVGAKESLPIDVRVIAATHEDLQKSMEEGRFREDLFYRICVIPINVPPLRTRKCDIMTIAYRFLETYSNKLSKRILGFENSVEDLLNAYLWPGNVRELENVVEYAVNISGNERIALEDLPPRFRDPGHIDREMFGERGEYEITPIPELELMEINKALDLYGHNKRGVIKASKALQISVATLYRRLKKMNER